MKPLAPLGGFGLALALTLLLAALLAFDAAMNLGTPSVSVAAALPPRPAEVEWSAAEGEIPDVWWQAGVTGPLDATHPQHIRGAFRFDDGSPLRGYRGPAAWAIPFIGGVLLDASSSRVEVKLDADANYDTALPAGDWWIEPVAVVDGATPPRGARFSVPPGQIVQSPDFIYNRYRATVQGKIVDDEGQPVRGIDVFGRALDVRMGQHPHAETGDDGNYTLTIGEGRWLLYTKIPLFGYEPPVPRLITVVHGGSAAGVDLLAPRLSGTVTGRVFNQYNEPVPFALVYYQKRLVVDGGLSIDASASHAYADGDGRFKLPVAAGTHDLQVKRLFQPLDYPYPTTHQVVVAPHQMVETDIVLQRATARVYGTVWDVNGARVGGGQVGVFQNGRLFTTVAAHWRDATYSVRLPDGEWSLQGWRTGRTPSPMIPIVLGPHQVQEIDFHLHGYQIYIPAIRRSMIAGW